MSQVFNPRKLPVTSVQYLIPQSGVLADPWIAKPEKAARVYPVYTKLEEPEEMNRGISFRMDQQPTVREDTAVDAGFVKIEKPNLPLNKWSPIGLFTLAFVLFIITNQ